MFCRTAIHRTQQLQRHFATLPSLHRALGRQNLIEKIAQRYTVDLKPGEFVRAGDYVSIQPAYVMTHDNTSAVISKFKSIGGRKIARPSQVVFTLDHNVQDKSDRNVAKYKAIEDFAKQFSIDFYPAGRGIGHQVMVEEGYAFPNTLVVASDSHSNMYGGIGCLGTPVVRTDAASIWATGRTWWQVPPVARVKLEGRLAPGATSKDVIIVLCGLFNKDNVLNYALEFTGSGLSSLTVDDRLTIANMTTEWGALAGVFPVDSVAVEWLKGRAQFLENRASARQPQSPSSSHNRDSTARLNGKTIEPLLRAPLVPDADAYYEKELTLDLSTVQPHVSGPNHVKVMESVEAIGKRKVKINKAYIVSCVNSRVDDLAAAAKVLRGRKVADGVQLYIAAASSEVQAQSEARNDWQTLVAAGARTLPAGCGPCIGLGTGLLEDGEVGISATNRNFKGRMGSRNAIAYLASPAVVAASAVQGFICGPESLEPSSPVLPGTAGQAPQGHMKTNPRPVSPPSASDDAAPSPSSSVEGFPTKLAGTLVFCHQDNLNTDGIYPGSYTYREDMTPELQAKVVMENYDAEFGSLVQKGDILVGGYNFGTGSSREQAATALKYKGFLVIVAGSFSETYKRNAVNNGLILIESPALVEKLKATFGTAKLTVRTGWAASIDFQAAVMSVNGEAYAIPKMGLIAQELIVAGGLEDWVKRKLASVV